MKRHAVILLLLFAGGLWAQDLSRELVSVTVTRQGLEFYSPWKRGKVEKKVLTGCVLEGNRILTIAYPMANHILVEVSKHGGRRMVPAEVVLKDYHTGLALLKVKDERFFQDLKPVRFAASGPPRGRVVVAKWDAYGTYKQYGAEVFKTAIGFYQSGGAVLLHHMTTGLDSGGNGEPVFVNSRLVGITSYFDSARKTIKVCAIDTIKHMLQDFDDGKYDGLPFFYINQAYLMSDENLRAYLGLAPEDTGMLVNGVYPMTSGHNVLKKGDVILSVDGKNIDDRGLYESAHYGKLNFYGLISLRHFVGDELKMSILRDKKKMDVSFKLLPITRDCFMIPPNDYDSLPQYYILGGLVFQELTQGYMTMWGSNWRRKADKRLLHLYDTLRLRPSPARRRIVVLNKVLPDSVNVGYHQMKNLVLLKVNNQTVRDLRHFKELVESVRDRFYKFDFQGEYTIVLNRDAVRQSDAAILKSYNIIAKSYLEPK
ncbi:MAG: PDZ domain-containing protein [Planctomycetes bacterium]|nr:PDZ domain-containing protein [Planctomycetota bacterium]